MTTVVFDWKQTLYEPRGRRLFAGAKELLDSLASSKTPMVLVGKGGEDMLQEVKRLAADAYFYYIYFAPGTKAPDWYDGARLNYATSIFVGDSPSSEIAVGNQLGAMTVRVRQGKFRAVEPRNAVEQANHTVSDLHQCLELIREHL